MPVILPPGVVTHPSSSAQNTIQTTSASVVPLTLSSADADISVPETVLMRQHTTSGTPGIGFGLEDNWQLHSSTNVLRDAAAQDVIWAVPTDGSQTSLYRLFTVTSGGGLAESFRLGASALVLGITAPVDVNVFAATNGGGVQITPPLGLSASYRVNSDGGSAYCFFGAANAAGAFITQSGRGDSFFRAETHNMLFSTDAGANTCLFLKAGTCQVGVGANVLSPAAELHVITESASIRAMTLQGVSSQTAALMALTGQSSTMAGRDMALVDAAWADATDATRQGRLTLSAVDFNATREGLRIEANGSAAAIGFLGAAAVVQQANASQAAITAVTDSNAKSALQAIYNLLHSYGLAPATA